MTLSVPTLVQTGSSDQALGLLVEELTAKLQAGQAVDLEAYIQEHSQYAEQLRQLLPALRMLADLGRSAVAGSGRILAVSGPSDEIVGTLGDFRIVQEIGRGGMGVVYEAEQISLGRRVALKVLPFAAALDPKQLQRFKNEAHAAAHLHHQHIVPVHGVGCERGVHYYAMQFIEGEPLDRVIQNLRRQQRLQGNASQKEQPNPPTAAYSPAPPANACSSAETAQPVQAALSTEQSITSREFFQSVARLGIQAAEALDHAHQQGILHRDIKPANLLLDVRGNLWITDFGLARFQNETRLSMTGDLIGTLRYMSPEQALAKRVVVDHRTDIYSLGVTLYELLTLEPAFQGGDREELLRQVAFEEPRSPRRLNRPIPAELETIVLKAMEKNPAERYATAQELADDLRRFLEDKPIRAKKPTWVQRAAKWCRRHKSAVLATAGVLILVIVGLAASTWVIWLEKEQTKVALREAQASKEQTKVALTEAQANAERAQQNLDTASKILDEIYVAAAEKRLPREKEVTAEDRQFLEKALTFYEEFAKQNSSDHHVRLKMAEAYRRVGGIHEQLGQEKQAAAAYHQALAISLKLAAELPEDPDCRRNLARSYSSLGGVFLGRLNWSSVRIPELEQAYAEALRLQEQLVREFPANLEDKRDLGFTYFRLGYMQLFSLGGPPAAAEEAVRRALRIREELVVARPSEFLYRQELGMSLGNLGNLLTWTRRFPAAEEVVRRELAVRRQLVDDFPAEPRARALLADAYMDLALLRNSTGKLREAVAAYRQELSLRKKLAAEFPNAFLYEGMLAWRSLELGDALRNMGAQDEALAAYEQAITASKEVIRLGPHRVFSYLCWRRALARMGDGKEAVAAWEQAVERGAENAEVANEVAWFLATTSELPIRNPDKAVQLARKAVNVAPQNGNFWNTLGTAYYRAAQWKDAVVALQKSTVLQSGGTSFDWFFLAMAHRQLGNVEKARHYYDWAVQWMEKNKPQDEEDCEQLRRFRAEAATLLGIKEEALNK